MTSFSTRTLAAAACALLALPSTGRADGAFDLGPGLRALAPVRHEQLAIFPVVRSDVARSPGAEYLTLRAGLERKEVFVEEVSASGTVNTLRISNRSARPLLILGGEIVLGGKQDRVMSRDTILAPGQVATVDVFCVEHGRWGGGRSFTAAGGLAEGTLRLRAKYGGTQSSVWEQVAKKNQALKAENSTGTYRGLVAGEEGRKVTEPYRRAISAALAGSANAKEIVGLVAAIGGRVASVDLFDSPALFAQYRDQLLDALYVTAADLPKGAPAAPPAPTDVREFFTKARAAPKRELQRGAGKAFERNSSGAIGSQLMAPAAAAEAKPVYESYQAH